MNRTALLVAFAAMAALVHTAPAFAHGFAGDRFFPATILTDDPFVADEMSLPAVTYSPANPDGGRETDIDIDVAKRILPDFGVTFAEHWKYVQPQGGPAITGFDAIDTAIQYQLFVDGADEAIGLLGLAVTWGHTGRVHGVGAPDFTTLSPTFDFGKGFGGLPDSAALLRPFAITGNLGFDIPMKSRSGDDLNPNALNAGFAIEYSLEYLQHHVRDMGLKAPFDRMIPLVEVAFSRGLDRGSGQTTGTVQPGVIWAGQYFQVGLEAIVPLNSDSGHGVGGVVQLHFFLDDLFANSIGRPLFRD
ncbi:MAG TPA: hypothetical protein VKZ79_21175 [Alphaproteobacteria bacterium]|nr:hypothetical protein [Alphaproteobacteria bacterium]